MARSKTKASATPTTITTTSTITSTEAAPAEQSSRSSSTEPDKKRKRTDPVHEELEVDVQAPEPPSKKAKRLLKKGKPLPVKPKSPSPPPLSPSPPPSTKKHRGHSATHDNNDGDNDNGDTNGNNSKENGDVPLPTNTSTRPTNTNTTKSPHGIWIGNLPFTATPETLRTFLQSHGGLTPAEITRIHMPPPAPASRSRSGPTATKPTNKGFAYVDFTSEEAQAAALALSETLMGGRPVLVKGAADFKGRPEKKSGDDDSAGADGSGKGGKGGEGKQHADGKAPGKRVFVGNLGFDMSQHELREHFEQCGEVAECFVATFEDTGKCKGYGWVTFGDADGAAKAVRGWVYKEEEQDEDDEDDGSEEEGNDDGDEDGGVGLDSDADGGDGQGKKNASTKKPAKNKKQRKPRKWFVNRLHGRDLRLEFGEDATHRYKKRFGKAPPTATAEKGGEDVTAADGEETLPSRPPKAKKYLEQQGDFSKKPKTGGRDGPREDRSWKGKREGGQQQKKKVDARNIQPGAANANAQRASAAIVEAKGKKIVFD